MTALFPITEPVLTPEQRATLLAMAVSWRSVMLLEDKGPLYYESSRVLKLVGFPATLELVARAAQAEADHEHRQGLRDVDWCQACSELFGGANAKAIHERACEIAGIDPQGGG